MTEPVQRPARVAYQGEPGAFSEMAIRQLYGDAPAAVPSVSFREVFERVEGRECDLGVVPIENSIAGSILPVYDLLLEHALSIVAETKVRIVHNLIARTETTLARVRQVFAHFQAAAQCEPFLRTHPEWRIVHSYDTAGSVKEAASAPGGDAAAIGSEAAARIHGMAILAAAIEADPRNFTRFVSLARDPAPPPQACKTSIVYSTRNAPGALYQTLKVFADRGLNLSKLESRPIPGRPWEYRFFVDLEAAEEDPRTRDALEALRVSTTALRRLGSYPA
ncbi:MAG: prephenate dehydratase [Planctomycetes bacterium]|nr:prephenate dehydratase [Planctomycetota bacterium]